MAKGRSSRAGTGDASGRGGSSGEAADRIIDATLVCIARDGWRRLALAAIATEAGVPLLQVYRAFGSKQAIMAALYRRVDEAVLAAPLEAELDERPRDRIFDLLMRRFDALSPYKPALDVLARELPSDPMAAACLGAALLRSMRWMLEAAGIATGGLAGAVAVRLVAATYLATMRVWLRDDAPDLARTMASLDRGLRRVERWLATGRRSPPGALPNEG